MANKPRIYMDSCCFIDLAKQSARILPAARANEVWFVRKLLDAHKDGEIEVFTSVLAIAECTHADGNVSQMVRDIFTRLLSSGQFLVLVQPTPFIAMDARDLRWKHGIVLGGMDAMHVASALFQQCTEILTTDKKITGQSGKLAKLGLTVTVAEKTKLLPPQYRQESLLDDPKITPLKRPAAK